MTHSDTHSQNAPTRTHTRNTFSHTYDAFMNDAFWHPQSECTHTHTRPESWHAECILSHTYYISMNECVQIFEPSVGMHPHTRNTFSHIYDTFMNVTFVHPQSECTRCRTHAHLTQAMTHRTRSLSIYKYTFLHPQSECTSIVTGGVRMCTYIERENVFCVPWLGSGVHVCGKWAALANRDWGCVTVYLYRERECVLCVTSWGVGASPATFIYVYVYIDVYVRIYNIERECVLCVTSRVVCGHLRPLLFEICRLICKSVRIFAIEHMYM